MKNCHNKSYILIFLLFLYSFSFSQVVINEISPNAGNNDGTPSNQTAEFIELYNKGVSAVDISCWVIADGDTWIRIPSGTTIASGGFYLIASSGYPSSAGIGTGFTGINCPNCDFAGLPINLDWGPTGIVGVRTGNNVIGSSCTPPNPVNGSSGNRDEAWVLFNNAGTIIDAIYFGKENNACGILYPINSPALSGLTGCGNEPAGKFIIPTVTYDGTDNNGYTYAGPQINGCNSSFQRMPDGGIWAKGDINNTTYPFGSQPTNQPTNHPTPGQSNSSLPFTFNGSGTGAASGYTGQNTFTLCGTGNITFTYVVNNYQKVQPSQTYDVNKVGSYVAATGAGSFAATNWTSVTPNSPIPGQTTLTHTVTPPVGTTTYELTWQDFIVNCCGSSSLNTPSNTNTSAWQCYERKVVTITRIAPMTASKTSIACPTDFTAGTIDISTLISGGSTKSYQLKDNGVNVGSANSTGVFVLATSLVGPITVEVTDVLGCTAPITININNNCKAAPVCPTIILNTATTTASGSKCPGDAINLCIDNAASLSLPIGGTVEWHKGINSSFDPFSTPNLHTTQSVGNACTSGAGTIKINELGIKPISGNGSGGDFIELFNGGCTPINIGCYVVAYRNNGATTTWTARIPSGTIVQPCSYYTIGGNSTSPAPNLNYQTCGCTSGTSIGTLVDGSAQVFLIDASNAIVDQVSYGATAPTGTTTTSAASGGCTATTAKGPMAASTAGINTAVPATADKSASFNGTAWSYQNTSTGAANNGGQTSCTSPKGVVTTCASYTISASDCNNGGSLFFKAIVKPIDGSCNQTNATTAAAGAYTVNCPTATLSGGGTICNGTGAPSSVNLTITASGSLNGYTFNYLENGVSKSVVLSGTSPYSIAVSTAGTFEAVNLVSGGSGCAGIITGTVEVTKKVPSLATTVSTCVSSSPSMFVFPVEAATETPISFSSVNAASATTNSSGYFQFNAPLTGTTQTFTMTVNGCSASTTATVLCDAAAPALPIHLLFWLGKWDNNNVLLSWKIAEVEENAYFEIERSTTGENFETIGKIDITSGKTDYSFIDKKAPSANNYYRLKINETNNKLIYSRIIKIDVPGEQQHLLTLVTPNPFTDIIKLNINVTRKEKIQLKLVDLKGVHIKTIETIIEAGSNNIIIDGLQNLASGQYILKTSTNNGSQQQKISKL